ncbi:FtsX-like permease family protein [Candidatus Lokiarchaeum ossiferum]|uniref:FtsX-like permease family protein n=1 Tax=Candidatus Lokiarchaeum ossiferum TaxID=2951803 RepID=UPI00352E840E
MLIQIVAIHLRSKKLLYNILNINLWFALKTLKKNKRQTKFTLLTITITIILYSSVLFIIDSTGSGWANYTRKKGGSQDILLYHTLPNTETGLEDISDISTLDYFFDYKIISEEIQTVLLEDVKIFPRNQIYYEYLNTPGRMYAVNFSYENREGMGPLNLNSNSNLKTNLLYGLNESECIIENSLANQNGWIIGSEIPLNFPTFNNTINYTVVGIIDEENAYTAKLSPSIIIDITNLHQIHPELQGKANVLALRIENYYEFYHLFNQKKTRSDLSNLGGTIIEQLGLEQWTIEYPNLFQFDKNYELILSFSFLTVYMGIGAALFCGLLFYNYLSLSLNEKIREMGVLKVMGAKSIQLFLQNFLQGFLISFSGTMIGMSSAFLLIKYLAFPLYNQIRGVKSFTIMVFSPSLNSAFSILTVGFFIPILITIILALRVSKWSIVNTLNPDHYIEINKQVLSPIQKNLLIITCSILWLIFNFFFFSFLPSTFSNREYFALFQFTSIIIYILFISGAIFILQFSKPLLNFLINFLFKEGSKFHEIIKIGISKHTSKIKGTIILVIIFFANLVAVLTMLQIIGNQIYSRNQFEIGSDIKLELRSGSSETFLKEDLLKLSQIPGVKVTTGMTIFPWDIDIYYHNYYKSLNASISNDVPSFSLQASDVDGLIKTETDIFGIDDSFGSTIAIEQIKLKEGNAEDIFNLICSNSTQNILISSELAKRLILHLDDLLKLDFKRNSEVQSNIFRIVGIYESIPGILVSEPEFLEFERNFGIVINQKKLIEQFGMLSGQKQFLNRILIKLGEEVSETQARNDIKEYFRTKTGSSGWFASDGIEEETQSEQEMFVYFKSLSFFLFFILVFMALVGFLSSAYGLFLERQQEIKIYRTLGLSIDDIQHLLLYEILLTFTLSGIIGTVIGIITAYFGSFTVSTFLNNNIQGKLNPPFGFILLLFTISYWSITTLYQQIFKKKHNFSVIAWENFVKRGV